MELSASKPWAIVTRGTWSIARTVAFFWDNMSISSGLGVLFIRKLGRLPGSRLHDDVETLFDERLDTSGRKRHSTFILEDFFGYADCLVSKRQAVAKANEAQRFTQETLLNKGAEQVAATTRRRLAMVHTHPTHTHKEELNRADSTPPGKETGERGRSEVRAAPLKQASLFINNTKEQMSSHFYATLLPTI
ncbi:hypothetical protein FQN60_008031 [Etheostoma spectabile]|uniref:Uncharacterized protein n=1 Tax=Etheostoma spectabile TaxID=54343 RepID=A0A5J5CU86_9PERO|nr:hypothetical protein FQN60_008031 [Etheostoma spectabile]